ncbi:MAG: hypothetical protein R6U91_03750 [Bacillota bacterium]
MNYFKLLGIAFGLAAFLKPFYMHLLPWDENRFLKIFYSETRPPWIVPLAIGGLGLIGLTWYLHLTLAVPNSIYITVLFSLTALKALTFLFDYGRFQKTVAGMLKKDKGRGIVMLDWGVSALGLIILVVTFLVY